MRYEDIYNLDTHINTADLLIDGIKESLNERGSKFEHQGITYTIVPPEHSRESIIRRCVQARQELLQVIKKLR